MDFLRKAKETLFSLLPVMAVVVILNFTIAPIGSYMGPFLVGSLMLLIGLTLFLSGAESGFSPVGERLGVVMAQKKNLPFMLGLGFLIGFGVTFAEPDVNVLAYQVNSMNKNIDPTLLKFMIAVGLGLFIDLGLIRTIKRIKLNRLLNILYLAVFGLVLYAGQAMSSIAFDASGSTTGPLAVPFILAIGLGVAQSSSGGSEDSFGLTGIASVGPIFAVLLLASFTRTNAAAAVEVAEEAEEVVKLFPTMLGVLKNTSIGLAPLVILIIILQFTLLKFPPVKFRLICVGIFYGFLGIVIFLTGVEYGFSPVGNLLGHILSDRYSSMLVPSLIALLFGAIVVIAEPAVWVLTNQVEEVTAGRIKHTTVMLALSIGVAVCVALSVVRVYLNINYMVFVFALVGLSLVLSWIAPPLFVAIAFDSGGVASGPMSTTFILSFIMGISGSAELGFGVVGMIAMSPLVAIQILGVVFKVKERKVSQKKEERRNVSA